MVETGTDNSHISDFEPYYTGCKFSQAAKYGRRDDHGCYTYDLGCRERPLCRDAYGWRVGPPAGRIRIRMNLKELEVGNAFPMFAVTVLIRCIADDTGLERDVSGGRHLCSDVGALLRSAGNAS